MTIRDHVHQPLDEEVTAIGGSYRLVREVRLELDGRELLYIIGHGVFDTTCCGAGGCAYALVPGFILEWKSSTNDQGLAVSKVEAIDDNATQFELSRLIRSRETVQDLVFL